MALPTDPSLLAAKTNSTLRFGLTGLRFVGRAGAAEPRLPSINPLDKVPAERRTSARAQRGFAARSEGDRGVRAAASHPPSDRLEGVSVPRAVRSAAGS